MEKKYQSVFDTAKALPLIEKDFEEIALPGLMDFVRIPNLSRQFDEKWESNGLILKAAKHICKWMEDQKIEGLTYEIVSEQGKSPLIFAEIPRTDKSDKTILIYTHIDKQPHGDGWKEGLGPITPVIKDKRLYGRGSSDDGYAPFAMIIAIKALQKLKYQHPRIVLTLESEEESGSVNYMYYLQKLEKRIGKVDYLICSDSGACSYDALWLSNSLRGNLKCDIKVQVLDSNVHSGDAGGIVPSSFRILRRLLDRIEDPDTGKIIDDFQVNIPPERYQELYDTAAELGEKQILKIFPYIDKMKPITENVLEAYLNKTWRPSLAVVGVNGIPNLELAGNVLRSFTTIRTSMRLPPTLSPEEAGKKFKQIIEKDPPYGCKVSVNIVSALYGWNAPKLDDQLQHSLEEAGQQIFKKEVKGLGEGGSIPLMQKLSDKWPTVQFIVTGVLGPDNNAHGANEMLDIEYTKKYTACMSKLITDISYMK